MRLDMYIDPGEIYINIWDEEILKENNAILMWTYFTDSLYSSLDNISINHICTNEKHIVRMYYYFALMSVTPCSLGIRRKYIVASNNEEYLMRNIECIQQTNKSLTYTRYYNYIEISPLPIIFKIGAYDNKNTYRVPECLGGDSIAFSIFADD